MNVVQQKIQQWANGVQRLINRFLYHLQPELLIERMNRYRARRGFGDRTRERFYRKLAAQLQENINILDALEDQLDRVRDRGGSNSILFRILGIDTPPMQVVLSDIINAVDEGNGFAKGIKPYAPNREVRLIRAGDETGQLGVVLEQAADVSRSLQEMRKTLKKLGKPAFYVCLTVALYYFFGRSLMPTFERILDPSKWTGTAQGVYQVSQFVQTTWFLYLLLALAGFGVLVYYSLPHRWIPTKFRQWLDTSIPPYTIYRTVNGSEFLLSMAAMMKANVNQIEALESMKKDASPWLDVRIQRIINGMIGSDRNLGEALDSSPYEFPNRELIDDIQIYSQLGDFQNVLYRRGKDWMRDAQENLESQIGTLRIVSIILVGISFMFLFSGFLQILLELIGGGMSV